MNTTQKTIETAIIDSEFDFYIGIVNHKQKTIERITPIMVENNDNGQTEYQNNSISEEIDEELGNFVQKCNIQYETQDGELEFYSIIEGEHWWNHTKEVA